MGAKLRRWLWPAIVLLVAGAIGVWAMRREAARMAAIEQQVRDICIAIGEDRDVTGLLNRDNSAVEEQVLRELQGVIDSRETATVIHVRVTPGDTDLAGPSAMPATHTAMIMIGDQEWLGLRIRCADATSAITILGCFDPARTFPAS
jgi:hypothetical protein